MNILCERRIPGYFGDVIGREVGNLEKTFSLEKPMEEEGEEDLQPGGLRLSKREWALWSVVRAASQAQNCDRWCSLLGALWS